MKIERLLKIKSSDFPFEFNNNKIIVIHITPASSLSDSISLDLKSNERKLSELFPIEVSGHNTIYNYDGRMNYFLNHEKKMAAYVQTFRNGIIESVNSGFLSFGNKKNINGIVIENTIRESIKNYVKVLTELNIDSQFFISITFLNIKGSRIITDNNMSMDIHRSVWGDFGGIHNNDILLPTVFIENIAEIDEKLDYSFSVFWNSDGYPSRPKS